jgi:hypothetical protein
MLQRAQITTPPARRGALAAVNAPMAAVRAASLTVSYFELPAPEQGEHLDLSALAALAEGSINWPDQP